MLCSRDLTSNVSRVLLVSLENKSLPHANVSSTYDATSPVTCPLAHLKKRNIALVTGFMARPSEKCSAKVTCR